MDPRGLPMFQHPRMTMMGQGQSDIGSVPGSIPINYQMNNLPLGTSMGIQGAGVPMSENHGNFTHKTPAHHNKMTAQQHHYADPSIRKEVYDQGRMDDGVLHKTVAHLPAEENNGAGYHTKENNAANYHTKENDAANYHTKENDEAHYQAEENDASHYQTEENNAAHYPTEENNVAPIAEEEIKTEQDEDIAGFMEMAHDVFLKISDKELTIEEASDFLGREYSFVYSRYQEFCDNITGKVKPKKKKHDGQTKKNGKKKKKPKKLTLGKKTSGRIFYCEDCPASFSTEYTMNTHTKMHLENKESHVCTACGVVFPRMGLLMNHRIEAHGDALQCPHCDEQFTVVASYTYHVKSHMKTAPMACKECGKCFFSKYTLRDHVRMHSGERPFMCGHCEKTFTTIGNLKSHQYVHTGWPKREKNIPCKECGKKYDTKYKLKQHMNSHTGAKPYTCDLCGLKFGLKANLARHRVHHTGEKPFKCNYCDYTCAFETDLKRHDMAHTGNKPFKCTFCDYSTVRQTLLEYHMNTHTGEKPYKCDFYGCSAEYSGLSTLKKHQLKHGPPPLKTCKVCHEKFTDLNSLKCHMMIHPGHKPVPCDQCDKIFYNDSTLKRHMHVHMYKPDGQKPRPVIKRKRNPNVKKVAKPLSPQKLLTSGYEAPITSANGPSSLAHSWTINAEDTNSQQSLQSAHYSFPPSQLTNLNAWPTTMDPDELRRRLLTSFN